VIALVAHLAAGRTIDVRVTLAMTAACVSAVAGGRMAASLPRR
jgi:hypothetical protein